MARKDLLKNLMDQNAAAREETAPAESSKPPLPRYSSGSIGAVSQSIAELKARAVSDIETRLIIESKIKDRLDKPDIDALAQSIADNGQQVPVLLRPVTLSGVKEQHYEIVYGRRRVAALKKLGLPVKALIRDMTDRQLYLAQGQENTARKDLSFIEKANFARQMRDLGYERKTICDALHVDKTVISRMLTVIDSLPIDMVEAIGAAPSVGRDRWMLLSSKLKGRNLAYYARGDSSDERFEAVLAQAVGAKPKPKPKQLNTVAGADGKPLVRITRGAKKTEFSFENKEFANWLGARMTDLHREWTRRDED